MDSKRKSPISNDITFLNYKIILSFLILLDVIFAIITGFGLLYPLTIAEAVILGIHIFALCKVKSKIVNIVIIVLNIIIIVYKLAFLIFVIISAYGPIGILSYTLVYLMFAHYFLSSFLFIYLFFVKFAIADSLKSNMVATPVQRMSSNQEVANQVELNQINIQEEEK